MSVNRFGFLNFSTPGGRLLSYIIALCYTSMYTNGCKTCSLCFRRFRRGPCKVQVRAVAIVMRLGHWRVRYRYRIWLPVCGRVGAGGDDRRLLHEHGRHCDRSDVGNENAAAVVDCGCGVVGGRGHVLAADTVRSYVSVRDDDDDDSEDNSDDRGCGGGGGGPSGGRRDGRATTTGTRATDRCIAAPLTASDRRAPLQLTVTTASGRTAPLSHRRRWTAAVPDRTETSTQPRRRCPGPDEPDRVPDAARLAGVEGRAGVGCPGRPVVHRSHRHRRQHAGRGRRVQQLQAALAHQHVHRVAGRVRLDGRRGRAAVQRHLGGV